MDSGKRLAMIETRLSESAERVHRNTEAGHARRPVRAARSRGDAHRQRVSRPPSL